MCDGCWSTRRRGIKGRIPKNKLPSYTLLLQVFLPRITMNNLSFYKIPTKLRILNPTGLEISFVLPVIIISPLLIVIIQYDTNFVEL